MPVQPERGDAGAVEPARWDDPGFVGIDPDLDWLLRRDHRSSDEKLTPVQKLAAELLAEVLQPERVDAMLDLAMGTVRRWSKDEGFRERTVMFRRHLNGAVGEPVYEAALKPAQRRAAFMEARGAKKVEIAKALRRHRSTLDNWGHDPVYRRLRDRYARQLQVERAQADECRSDAERAEELRLAHEAIGKGLRNPDFDAAGKLGVAVMKLYHGGK